MALTLRVVCRPAIAPGFVLAGLTAEAAADASAAAACLRRLVRAPDTGLVLIEDCLYAALPEELRAQLERARRPIVTPFPGPRWDARRVAEDSVREILRRAVGYRLPR